MNEHRIRNGERHNAQSELEKQFGNFWRKKGYDVRNGFPLLDTPNSLLLVNSTIAPYIDLIMADGIPEDLSDVFIQNCIRANATNAAGVLESPDWVTSFRMGGITTTRSLESVTRDTLVYLTSAEGLSIDPDKLGFTYPSGHAASLEALLEAGCSEDRLIPLEGNEVYWTVWQYGLPGPTGYGITVLYDTGKEGAYEDILSLRYEQFLNVISIEHLLEDGAKKPLKTPIIDVGFGIEKIVSLTSGEKLTDISKYVEVVAAIKGTGNREKRPVENESVQKRRYITAADHFLTTQLALMEGVLPGAKGPQNIIRKIMRNMFAQLEILGYSPASIIPLFEEKFQEIVSHEVELYFKRPLTK